MMQFLPITDVYAREILDFRGRPALEIVVAAGEDCLGRAQVPGSKTDRGRIEAQKAIDDMNHLMARELMDKNIFRQVEIDEMLEQFAAPQTHWIWGMSLAVARCAASACRQPLYRYLGGVGDQKLPVPVVCLSSEDEQIELIDVREYKTITRTIEGIKEAKARGREIVLMDQANETPDTGIVDLAVAFQCEKMMIGSCSRGAQITRYNRLLEIADQFTFIDTPKAE